ncbi:MAG: hydrogenase maturation protease [bacterium]|nr:hydrogenase maturation protease [bacterium]
MKSRTLVLGIGNPTRRDDGIGIQVVRHLRSLSLAATFDIEEASCDWLALLDLLVAYDRVVIVDAVQLGKAPGTVVQMDISDLPNLGSRRCHTTLHDLDLVSVVELGRQLGYQLPEVIQIVGVEAEYMESFSEACSPLLLNSLDEACDRISELLLSNA